MSAIPNVSSCSGVRWYFFTTRLGSSSGAYVFYKMKEQDLIFLLYDKVDDILYKVDCKVRNLQHKNLWFQQLLKKLIDLACILLSFNLVLFRQHKHLLPFCLINNKQFYRFPTCRYEFPTGSSSITETNFSPSII